MKSVWTNLATIPLLAAAVSLSSCATTDHTSSFYDVNVQLKQAPLHPVSGRLFGQMLEKRRSGEPGPELIVDMKTGKFPPSVVSIMQEMEVPLIRFEAGGHADYTDWRDTINHAPGKPRFRPLTMTTVDGRKMNCRFGVDEFGRLKQELKFEAIIVVNLLDGLARRGPVREAAERAAGIVAYCNATSRTKLPQNIRHWPAIRAKNGNPIPFGIEYVQLGSHMSSARFREEVQKSLPQFDEKQLSQWYIDCISYYIQLIRTADPSIKIIMDAHLGAGIEEPVWSDKYISENIDLISVSYSASERRRPVDADAAWFALCTALGSCDASGNNIGLPQAADYARKLNKRVAITEWNSVLPKSTEALLPPGGRQMADALACGAWFNGLLRSAETVDMAVQPLLLGSESERASIAIDQASATQQALTARGMVASLYSRFHGDRWVPLEDVAPPVMSSGSTNSWRLIDLTATVSESNLYIHAVNRSRTQSAAVVADCSNYELKGTFTLRAAAPSTPSGPDGQPTVTEHSSAGNIKSPRKVGFTLVPASVSVIEIPLK